MAVEAATAGAASEPGSAAWLTFLLRPEQSCVARVTCTVLYTLNHSGWWHICDRLERQARQHEKLIQELGLEGSGVKGLSTPYVKPTVEQLNTDRPLPSNKITHFRVLAARAKS